MKFFAVLALFALATMFHAYSDEFSRYWEHKDYEEAWNAKEYKHQ
ncbi:hypothetical protein ACTNNG_004445 [Vibrio parahaemolyticus]